MPDVSELLNTIKDLALVGAGDASDDSRVMRYMNLVYKEAYRRTAQARPTLLLDVMGNIAISNGSGTLTARPYAVTMVKDTGNNSNPLNATTLPELEEKAPALDATGNPDRYYLTGETTINTYPKNTTTVSVRYVPAAGTLTSDSVEADIKIPPEFHDLLVWGTLVYLAYDERDKGVGVEVQTAQSKYEIALADYQSWLLNGQVKATTRTKAIMG
jgi:hypothetical protein